MIAQQSLDLAAEPFRKSDDFRLFCLHCDPFIAELAKNILAYCEAKAFGPAVSGNRYMHRGALEAIKDGARDYFPVALYPNARKWREKPDANYFTDKPDYSGVGDDQLRMSPMS
jgi:hypothetical protein